MSKKKMFWERPRDAFGRFMSLKKSKATDVSKVEFGKNHGTAQIYSSGYEFAFMSKVEGVYKQVCTFVYCKDFLHDAVWAWINKTKWSIYGFSYDSSKHLPLDADNCVFAFRNTQFKSKPDEFHAKREACQEFLNKFEKECGFDPSQVLEVNHPDGIPCWLVVGDKRWQHAPALVGLYTLLIRTGIAHKPGTSHRTTLDGCKNGKVKVAKEGAGIHDPRYIKSSWKGVQAVLKHGTDCFHPKMEDNYPKELPKKIHSLHNNAGPVNWVGGSCKKGMPRWYKHL